MKHIILWILLLSSVVPAHAFSDLETGYNSKIFDPAETIEGGGRASGTVKAKTTCTDIKMEFSADAYLDTIQRLLEKIGNSTRIIAINAVISTSAYYYAYSGCKTNFLSYLTMHPELRTKIEKCVNEEAAIKQSFGAQAGMWVRSIVPETWVNVTTENTVNPLIGMKFLGCAQKELSDEIGEDFRGCIDENYKQNVQYILKYTRFALEKQLKAEITSTQECVLELDRKETLASKFGSLEKMGCINLYCVSYSMYHSYDI